MIDENAFGLHVVLASVEDDEYALERTRFIEHLARFDQEVLDWLAANPLGEGVQAVHLGHAVYFEIAEGDETQDPFVWLRGARDRLHDAGFAVVAILAHGSRWVGEAGAGADFPGVSVVGDVLVARVSRSSEPLRKSLAAEAAALADDDSGWGPGLYIDVEAIEAMDRRLRNAPTGLSVGGATFYRFGS